MVEPIALGVFAKAPTPRKTKTRLAATLGPERAARLHEAFILDVLEHASSLGPTTLFVTEDHPFLRDAAETTHVAIAFQEGNDLGARMDHALRRLRTGAKHGVLVGSDAPWWPPGALKAAVQHDVALGPSNDGGFYLIAAAKALTLNDIRWSAPTTLDETMAANPGAIKVEPWFDVDDYHDLMILKAWLGSSPTDYAPHTREALDVLGGHNAPVIASLKSDFTTGSP